MKTALLLVFFCAALGHADPQPTASEFETFLGFSESCPVAVQDVDAKKAGIFGNVIWLKAYVPVKSRYQYIIGVSKKRTFLKDNRAKIEEDIQNRPRDFRRMGPQSFLYKEVVKTELGDAFFTIDSVSKEMTSMMGFITVDEYDVFAVEYAVSDPRWRASNPDRHPLQPKNRLPEVLDYIARLTKKH